MKKNNILLILALWLPSAVFSFSPENYASAEDTFYIEVESSTKATNYLKDFLLGLLGPSSETIVASVAEQAKERTGVNPLSSKDLLTIGFDPASKMSVTGNFVVNPEGLLETKYVRIYFPAKNSDKLYAYMLQRAKMPDEAGTVPAITEHIKGRLFEIPGETPLFVIKGSDFIAASNSRLGAVSAVEMSKNKITDAEWYVQGKKEFSSVKAVAWFYINPTQYMNAFSAFSGSLGSTETPRELSFSSALIRKMQAEVEENIVTAGGYFTLNKSGIVGHFVEKYKNGYLQSSETALHKLINPDAPNLSLDSHPGSPLLYFMVKLNFAGYLQFIEESVPEFKKEMERTSEEIAKEAGLDLRKDLLAPIHGNFSMTVADIPPEKDLQNPNAWNGFFSMGIAKGSSKNYVMLIEKIMAEENAKPEDNRDFSIKKGKQGKHTLFTITLREKQQQLKSEEELANEELDGLSMDEESATEEESEEPAPVVKETFAYIIITDTEIIGTTNPAAFAKIEKSKESTLAVRNFPKSGKYYTGGIIDIATVVAYAKTSSFSMFVAQYLQMVERIDKLTGYAKIDGDNSISRFELRLKPTKK